jgi:hypothetical protein
MTERIKIKKKVKALKELIKDENETELKIKKEDNSQIKN